MEREMPLVYRYPEIAMIERVRELMGRDYGFSAKETYLGSGVDALIDLVARVFVEEGDDVLVTIPTYPCYSDAVKFMGGNVREVGLRPDLTLDPKACIRAMTPRTKLIFLANPNYPLGNMLLTIPEIEAILRACPGIVVLDEEYVDFSGVSAVPLLRKYKNMIVLRGFSKSVGISGLRLGVLYARSDIIRLFDNSQGATQVFEVNRLAIAAGEAIATNNASLKKFVAGFMARKRVFERALERIPGIIVRPTVTPFVVFSTPLPASQFRERLLKKKIAMKSLSFCGGIPENLVMSGVPRPGEMQRVFRVIREVSIA
jgi:histidinol-phosphate aminotransferase